MTISGQGLHNRLSTSRQSKQMAAFLLKRLLTADLDEKVIKAYPLGGWDEYRSTIERCGNPPDQIANFERARVILQPKQLEFAAWARRLDEATAIEGEERGAPELGMGGAKGPGKSFVLFAQTALDDCQRFPGLKVLYLRKTGRRAQEQIEDLIGAVLGHIPYTYSNRRVTFPNGSFIVMGHFQHEKEALNYAGIEYDLIVLEEATTLSQRAYKALRQSARTSKAWRPRIYNSTNPLGIGHKWYKQHFIDHERKYHDRVDRTRKFVFATVDDNRFINPDYRGNLEDLTGIDRRAYLEGDWDVSAGAYFDQWRHDLHVVQPIRILPHWRVWASMDYGFNHWNVILLHAKDGDGVTYTFGELCSRKRYPAQIVADFQQLLAKYGLTIARLDKFFAGTDVFNKTGASEKSVAEQYRDLGIMITQAEMSEGSRIGGAHLIARLLGNADAGVMPTWFVTTDCRRLIDTMPYLEANPNNPEDVLKVDADKDGIGGDDAYDAARYGLFTNTLKALTAETKRYA